MPTIMVYNQESNAGFEADLLLHAFPETMAQNIRLWKEHEQKPLHSWIKLVHMRYGIS